MFEIKHKETGAVLCRLTSEHDFSLQKASLRGHNLAGAQLGPEKNGLPKMFAEVDLTEVNLEGANLVGVFAQNSPLCGANLAGADLSNANLDWSHLTGANLAGACLKGTKIKGCCLHRANLRGADLRGADLSNAFFVPLHPDAKEIKYTTEDNLQHLVGACTLDGAIYDDVTRWPEGCEPSHWDRAACDVCHKELFSPSGHLLTTTQVVAAPRYWERFYEARKQRIAAKLGVTSYRQFTREPAKFGASVARNGSPWLVCDDCIGLFAVDQKRTKDYARQWWHGARNFQTPGTGPADVSVINMRPPKKWWQFWK